MCVVASGEFCWGQSKCPYTEILFPAATNQSPQQAGEVAEQLWCPVIVGGGQYSLNSASSNHTPVYLECHLPALPGTCTHLCVLVL